MGICVSQPPVPGLRPQPWPRPQFNSVVTVIVDRNETKCDLSKKQQIKMTTASQVKQKKKQSESLKEIIKIKENKNSFETSFKPL